MQVQIIYILYSPNFFKNCNNIRSIDLNEPKYTVESLNMAIVFSLKQNS